VAISQWLSKVKTGQPVNSGQGSVTVGQQAIFILFSAGGSFIGTLIDLAMKR